MNIGRSHSVSAYKAMLNIDADAVLVTLVTDVKKWAE
jgi:hypothetical protein